MKAVGAAVLLVLAACAPVLDRRVDEMPANAPPELGATMNVRVETGAVRFELHVMNSSAAAIAAEFPTAQRFDFEVLTAGGERIWRWSDGEGFAQALGREELAPGETRVYRAEWTPGGATGDYVAIGRLVSTNLPVELSTPVHLPGH